MLGEACSGNSMFPMIPLRHLLLTSCIFLIGCSQTSTLDQWLPKEEGDYSKQLIATLAAGQLDDVERVLDPSIKTPDIRQQLQKMVDLIPSGTPSNIEAVGVHSYTTAENVRWDLSFQYAYSGKWMIANVLLLKKSSQTIVTGIRITPMTDSLQNINRFTFSGKGVVHFLFLAMTVIVPIFVLVVLGLCIRTAIPRRKWLWIIFVAVGFVPLSLNWTTGAVNINFLEVLLMGAAFNLGGLTAPTLTWAIPVGAIWFLKKRRAWQSNKTDNLAAPKGIHDVGVDQSGTNHPT